jgi:RNA polymerase sigma-70 factor (ECF subfamily)
VYRRARHLLNSEEEAKDAMQEVFLRVAQSHESFRGEVPMLRWIYRITTNLCLNRIRKRKTHPVVSDPDAMQRIVDGRGGDEDRYAMMQVLGHMDPLTQKIAVHHYVDGMHMEEVAGLVGYSRKTVGKKLAQFRQRAQKLLGGTP